MLKYLSGLNIQTSPNVIHVSCKRPTDQFESALLQAIERERDALRGDLQASRNKCADSEAEVSSCRAAAVEHAKQVSTPLFMASLRIWSAAAVLSACCCLALRYSFLARL